MNILESDIEIKKVLSDSRNIVIVGISDKPNRPSYEVAQYLREHTDYKIFYVNPMITEVFGEKVFVSLEEVHEHLASRGESIDIVDVFRRVEEMEPIFSSAVSVGAKSFWQQLGLRGGLPEDISSDINLISDKCIKIEYARLVHPSVT